MKKCLVKLIILLIPISFNGQILNKLDALKNSDLYDIAKEKIGEKYLKAKEDYESKTFSYSIIISDNTGLYENEQKYKKYSKLILDNALNDPKSTDNSYKTGANTSNNSGELFFASRKYKWAEAAFLDAKMKFETFSVTDDIGYSKTIANLGQLYSSMGSYDKSQEYTQMALEIRKKEFSDTASSYAASVNNMGVLLKDLGKYQEAIDSLDKALALTEKMLGKNNVGYAIILNNSAMLSYVLGQYTTAEKKLNEVIAISENTLNKSSNTLIRFQINLSMVYRESKKYEEAEKILLKCIKIKENKLGTSHPDYANLLTNLASLYMLMNKKNEVENLLLKSSKIYKKEFGEEHPTYALSQHNLGSFYRINKRFKEAEPLLTNAHTIRLKTLGNLHPDYMNSVEELALLYWDVKKYDLANENFQNCIKFNLEFVKKFFPAMSENEKSKLWSKIRVSLLKYYAYVSDVQDDNNLKTLYNLHINTKGILLNSSNKIKNNILNSGNKDLIVTYEKWLDQKAQLAKYYTFSKKELTEEKINLDSLETESEKSEKKLSQLSNLFVQEQNFWQETDLENIIKYIKTDEKLVDILHFQKYNGTLTDSSSYAAFIVAPSGTLTFKLLPNGHELDKKYFNYYKNSIASISKDNYTYQKFWSKIDSCLVGAKRIIVSTDGVYNLMNINTFKDFNNTYLIDKYKISYSTSSKITANTTSSVQNKKSAVLLGYPNFGKSDAIENLPGTKVELEKANLQLKTAGYSTKLLTQNNASEKEIKSVSNPYILHIATHGYFLHDVDQNNEGLSFGIESQKAKENPMLRGGLLLAGAGDAFNEIDTLESKSANNGIFTAYEASNLNLTGTELVFLSACETGKGEIKSGEGVYGLQRAFQIAGAKTLIMSLWKVNDETTQKLINSFYSEWLKTGNKVESFIKAQKQVKLAYPEPIYWGAFVLL
ncbi:MAG: CHAT domain-containing tetratricopeptide repeat protein [Cytophagales bacterium]